jgi:hypothetical protein
MDMNTVKEVADVATSVIGIASIFAAFLPQPASGILLALKKAIDMGAWSATGRQNAQRR